MKGAYYNEHDSFAAEWLRNLIFMGEIAPGDVDERSIEDVRADDLGGYVQHHFFAGIGVWSRALREAGWPDDRPVWTGSCPCQPFSTAGKGGGFADERHLWPAWFWLIEQHRPDLVLGEQVANKAGLGWFDLVSSDLEGADYACGAVDLCAAGLGAPHIRQRNYWMAHGLSAGRAQGWSWTGLGSAPSSSSTGGLAHDDGDRSSSRRRNDGEVRGLQEAQRQPELGSAVSRRSGEYGDVVNASGEQEGLSGRTREPGGAGVLAHHHHHQRRNRIGAQSEQGGRCEPEDDRELGNNNNTGLAVGSFETVEPGTLRVEGPTLGETGLVRGRWSGADWIFCRDGKWRPVEAGTFPLAYGAPARVGRLRGYGNAIVLPVAQAFIEAVKDLIDG